MKSPIGATTALTAVVFTLAAAGASAAPVTVDLRVEGSTKTIFEGRVTTDAHAIEQDRTGPQRCDGTTNPTNRTPGPTATSALDDAVAWDGSYDASFGDFLINRIGSDKSTSEKFWGLIVNGTDSQAGGCQTAVKAGDDVVWAYDSFAKKQYLKLTGPSRVRRGKTFRVKVVDTKANNAPVRGARVAGARTNAKGFARLKARRRGTVAVKATRAQALRSNALRVRVR